jgi:hypothetical protein
MDFTRMTQESTSAHLSIILFRRRAIDSWCQKALQEYLNAIEEGLSNAGKEVLDKKTL